MREWELSLGFYPGILVGFRSYEQDDRNNHVLYLPFVDICLTTLKGIDESDSVSYTHLTLPTNREV